MSKSKKTEPSPALSELEKAQEQYREYLEISRIHRLPIFRPAPPPPYSPPCTGFPIIRENFPAGK